MNMTMQGGIFRPHRKRKLTFFQRLRFAYRAFLRANDVLYGLVLAAEHDIPVGMLPSEYERVVEGITLRCLDHDGGECRRGI